MLTGGIRKDSKEDRGNGFLKRAMLHQLSVNKNMTTWNLVQPWIALRRRGKAIEFKEEEKYVEYNKIKIFY